MPWRPVLRRLILLLTVLLTFSGLPLPSATMADEEEQEDSREEVSFALKAAP